MEISHNNLPEALSIVLAKLDKLLIDQKKLEATGTTPPETIHTTETAAKELSITPETVRQLAARGEIAHSRANGRLYFLHSDLLDYLKSKRIPTQRQTMSDPTKHLRPPRKTNP